MRSHPIDQSHRYYTHCVRWLDCYIWVWTRKNIHLRDIVTPWYTVVVHMNMYERIQYLYNSTKFSNFTTLSILLFSVFAKRLLWSVLGGVRNHCCYLVSIDIDMNIYVVLPLLLEDYCALVQIESANTNQRNTN